MAEKNERRQLRPHRRGTPVVVGPTEPPRARPSRRGTPPRPHALLGALVVAVVAVVGGALALRAALSPAPATPPAPPGPSRVSFVAVGDNLPEIEMAAYADAQAGEQGDGDYDYSPIFAPVRDYVQAADLAYVKEETHLGGDDIGPKGYPSFNTTDQMADALVDAGFDLVGSASNHSYDWGSYGANEHSRSVWNSKPVAFAGTASSAQEADELALVEREGITFALLDYTYGVNGYEREDLPDYAVSFIDRDRIAADVGRAREQADVVLVAMHWGTENLMEADQTQREYAQYLADLGVDVVLGSHPHVIGPVTWLTGEGGNRTLVAYSLGNFTSNHEVKRIRNELEGMLSCDFVKDGDAVSIENVRWTPLVMHTDGTSFAVYALKDYTPELAAAHPGLAEEADPIAWLRQTSSDVVNALGDEFPIDM